MNVLVLTPDKEVFQGKATSVQAPGLDGLFEVLDRHAAMVSALGEGQVRIKTADGQKLTFSIERGYMEVLQNEVSLLIQGYKEN
jgi:F-type H+-transporting ATPase subunit epsilon